MVAVFAEYKVKEAIPFLLQHIDMDRDLPRSVSFGAEARYQPDINNKPAVLALSRIGNPEPFLLLAQPTQELAPFYYM